MILKNDSRGIDRSPPGDGDKGDRMPVTKRQKLMSAIKSGDLASVTRLLRSKEIVHASEGDSPLLEALSAKHWDIAQVLLDVGADLNELCGMARSPVLITLALERNEPHAGVSWLLERGADPNLKWGFQNLLCAAAAYGDKETAEVLLRFGADPNEQRSIDGLGPLSLAARDGYMEVVAMLLEAGADYRQKDHNGLCALDWAKKDRPPSVATHETLRAWQEREELSSEMKPKPSNRTRGL